MDRPVGWRRQGPRPQVPRPARDTLMAIRPFSREIRKRIVRQKNKQGHVSQAWEGRAGLPSTTHASPCACRQRALPYAKARQCAGRVSMHARVHVFRSLSLPVPAQLSQPLQSLVPASPNPLRRPVSPLSVRALRSSTLAVSTQTPCRHRSGASSPCHWCTARLDVPTARMQGAPIGAPNPSRLC
eukprot:359692-Chlamydomonas_euryale.AAC.4